MLLPPSSPLFSSDPCSRKRGGQRRQLAFGLLDYRIRNHMPREITGQELSKCITNLQYAVNTFLYMGCDLSRVRLYLLKDSLGIEGIWWIS